jgi:serine/threonine-protein kinase RsbT
MPVPAPTVEERVAYRASFPLATSDDLVRLRQAVREQALLQGFSLVEQTKVVTAASELGRNTLVHGGGGVAEIERVELGARRGLRLTFTDRGPGIADLRLALTDGYSSGGGLGLGLGGARRLCNEFDVESSPGAGTRVRIARWR